MEAIRKEQDLQQAVQDHTGVTDLPEFLQEQLARLSAYGGFSLLESAIDGTASLNPDYPARKNIFLTDGRKQAEREALLKTLTQWAEVLEHSDAQSMVDHCDKQAEHCAQVLQQDMTRAVDASRELERSYRNAGFFFKNCETDRVGNVSFINSSPDQLKDLEDTRFIDAIVAELVQHYDRLDLRNNYSILVIPGYLGSNKLVEKWAKIAFENKVMMITDFEHLDEPDDIMEMFARSGLASGDIFKSNVIMTCNWLTGRGRLSAVGEESDLYVPPSGALAGKIYSTLMSQVTAGKKFGVLSGVDGVKFELKKTEIANLEKMGLVPMVRDFGKVMAFSAKTLFNGDNLGLQTYSVVRVFDYVTKVLIDFLNRRAFENFNSNTRKELMNQIVTFLDGITGPDKLIEDFTVRRFEQDSLQKDRIHLDIHMKPYFPAKNFLIRMEGQKSDEGNHWGTTYDQDK